MSLGEERELVPLGAGFDFEKRGYNRAQVDEHLERLDADIKMLMSDRDAAISQADDLARQLEAAGSRSTTCVDKWNDSRSRPRPSRAVRAAAAHASTRSGGSE